MECLSADANKNGSHIKTTVTPFHSEEERVEEAEWHGGPCYMFIWTYEGGLGWHDLLHRIISALFGLQYIKTQFRVRTCLFFYQYFPMTVPKPFTSFAILNKNNNNKSKIFQSPHRKLFMGTKENQPTNQTRSSRETLQSVPLNQIKSPQKHLDRLCHVIIATVSTLTRLSTSLTDESWDLSPSQRVREMDACAGNTNSWFSESKYLCFITII